MRKHGLCCRPVSVCLSVTLVHCIYMAEDIFKLLCQPSSPIILVYWPQVPVPNSKGNHSTGCKIHGDRKILRFSMYEIGPLLLWNLNRKYICSIEWLHFQWPCQIPNSVFKVTAFLKSNISKTSHLSDKSYYRTLIVYHTQSIDLYHFHWPRLTLDWDFKVAIFFNIEKSQKQHEIEP